MIYLVACIRINKARGVSLLVARLWCIMYRPICKFATYHGCMAYWRTAVHLQA